MYKKAVEKSRAADALIVMNSIDKSEHDWYLVKNNYTKDFSDLDIELTNKEGNKAANATLETENYTFTLQDDSIKAQRNNNEYSLYKFYDVGGIYCLPQEHYICQLNMWKSPSAVNKGKCGEINGFWANSNSTCYSTSEDRCKSLYGDSMWKENGANSFCGVSYVATAKLGEYQECRGGWGSCYYSTFTGEGSQCLSVGDLGCRYSYFYGNAECQGIKSGGCNDSEFFSGSTCIAKDSEACSGSVIHSGAKCIANASGGCRSITLEANAVCERKAGSHFGGCTGNIYGTVIADDEHYTNVSSTFYEGSSCIGNVSNSCGNRYGYTTFKSGSRCIANVDDACNGSIFEPGSCCKGHCSASAPNCDCPKNEDGSYPTSCP